MLVGGVCHPRDKASARTIGAVPAGGWKQWQRPLWKVNEAIVRFNLA